MKINENLLHTSDYVCCDIYKNELPKCNNEASQNFQKISPYRGKSPLKLTIKPPIFKNIILKGKSTKFVDIFTSGSSKIFHRVKCKNLINLKQMIKT